MTRRSAAERHRDSAPPDTPGGESGPELLDVLTAFHHPTRRWLAELLWLEGPASVGRLAERTGLAVGSVSHHLKSLHRHGFVEPAPELARDTRESWWRGVNRRISWESADFAGDTLGRQIARTAEVENFRHQVRAVRDWFEQSADAPDDVRRLAHATDALVPATDAQVADLGRRLDDLLVEWSHACRDDAAAHPGLDRRPIRVFARAFPSGPVRP